MTPELSVVVPVRDGAAALPRLLASLRAQQLADDRYEVVVVDNGSSDGSGEVAATHGARVVSEPRKSRSLARNAGAGAARAELIAFTDADCVATPGWLAALLACRGSAPLVAGAVEIERDERANVVERFEACWRFDQRRAVKSGWAATANLMVERDALAAIGGFDPAYDYGEDVDFCLRARRAGHRIAFCPDALVLHAAERRLAPVLRRGFLHGYGAAQLERRLGSGHVAWRHPRPLVSRRTALAMHSIAPESLSAGERRRQAALAQATYASRIVGSLWATVRRAR